MKELVFPNAPKIAAHYAPAVLEESSGTVYVSGQLPIDPVTRIQCRGDVREQTLCALTNVEKILHEAGGGRGNILRTTAYVDDIASWDVVNDAYREFFGAKKPARTIVCVPAIHFGMKIEIEAIAHV